MATNIEWTRGDDGSAGEVWNPTTGCDVVSAGCQNCYAMVMAKRLKGMGSAKYQTDGDPRTSGPGFGLAMHEDSLAIPLRWHKPRRIFVNSMSDLFHPKVTDEFLAKVFAVMVVSPRHTFQVLTKRAPRMAALLSRPAFWEAVSVEMAALPGWSEVYRDGPPAPLRRVPEWIWMGVSVEDQEQADARIPRLLQTPAITRWLSCEPLLGPVDLMGHLNGGFGTVFPGAGDVNWVVCGGESGPNARLMRPEWAKSLWAQCAESGTTYFFKQAGAVLAREWGCTDPKGHNPEEWPVAFPREFPTNLIGAVA